MNLPSLPSMNARNVVLTVLAGTALTSLVATIVRGNTAVGTVCCVALSLLFVFFLVEHKAVSEGTYRLFGSEATFKKILEADATPLPLSLAPSEDMRLSDFANLGELIWYLTSPGASHVDSVDKVIGQFLSHLDRCKLPNSQRAAAALRNFRLVYIERNGIITAGTGNALFTVMTPIRNTIFAEADALYSIHRKS